MTFNKYGWMNANLAQKPVGKTRATRLIRCLFASIIIIIIIIIIINKCSNRISHHVRIKNKGIQI